MVDIARYHVSSAFMEVYPDFFSPDQVFSCYEGSRNVIVWQAFKKSLSSLYKSYHKPLKHAGDWYLCQCHSLFEGHGTQGGFRDQAGKADDTYSHATFDTAPLVEDFSLVKVMPCKEDGTTNETAEARITRELKFHVPLFILFFNRAKKRLSSTEQDIYDLRVRLHRDESDYAILSGIPQGKLSELSPDLSGDRFRFGMASHVRNTQSWKDYVLQEQSRSPFSDFKQASQTGSPDRHESVSGSLPRSASPDMEVDTIPAPEPRGKYIASYL